jgi:hypothetical protein
MPWLHSVFYNFMLMIVEDNPIKMHNRSFFYALLIAFQTQHRYTTKGSLLFTKCVLRRRLAENMDMRTMLIASLVFVLICIIGLIIFSRNHRKYSSSIVATVTKVEVEATSLSSGWVVTAQWSDQQSGQTLSFRSHRLQFPPRLAIGGTVQVNIDPRNPTHYHMDL